MEYINISSSLESSDNLLEVIAVAGKLESSSSPPNNPFWSQPGGFCPDGHFTLALVFL